MTNAKATIVQILLSQNEAAIIATTSKPCIRYPTLFDDKRPRQTEEHDHRVRQAQHQQARRKIRRRKYPPVISYHRPEMQGSPDPDRLSREKSLKEEKQQSVDGQRVKVRSSSKAMLQVAAHERSYDRPHRPDDGHQADIFPPLFTFIDI